MLPSIWLLVIVATALGIVADMCRLRASRVGLGPIGWLLASIVFGPFAGIAYGIRRRAVRTALVDAAWQLIGDATHPLSLRYERLCVLERSGALGRSVFHACLDVLEAERTDVTPGPDAEPSASGSDMD
ncbi:MULTISPECIES: hypothetical protein [unclassified Caballeronia]|uniref:hypothetical protein n=1 Tax=unclassified Caballeronia TaxID=2646786 RepID=UPI0020294772|nr:MULTISPECIES: hypothetical protein [unclassified Caballeronia]